jgi:hypothetical protein
MPDPTPEVVERAQVLVNGAASGSMDSKQVVESVTTQDDRLRFLAHLLGGIPYRKTYEILGGAQAVTFTTISAVLDTALAKLALEDAKEHRKAKYLDYLMLASLLSVRTGDSVVEFAPDADPKAFRVAYEAWFVDLNREQYLVLRGLFDRFRGELDAMLGKVDDPSFWPTPS